MVSSAEAAPMTEREAWERERLYESLDAYRRGMVDAPVVQRTAVTQTLRANEDRPLTVVASDESVDRMGDVVRASGWDLAAYQRNPVFLWAHDHTRTPIGRCEWIGVDGTRLLSTMSFAPTAFAQEVETLYRQRFLRAVSVGFRAQAFTFRKDGHGQVVGIEYTKQELVEISAVAVPANPQALARALESKLSAPRMRSWLACGKEVSEEDARAVVEGLRRIREVVA